MENNQSIPKPDENLFTGFIIRGTDEDIKAIKAFILTQTAAKLIYQKKDSGYFTFADMEK